MVDQAVLGKLVAMLMDRIDAMAEASGAQCEVGDMALVAEVLTEDECIIVVQSNQLRKHHLRGLLAEADTIVALGKLEAD